MGCYYGFEKRANEVATNRINTFAYANRAAPRWARKQRKPLRTKTFAYANGEFPYANPGRGDVSPFCRRASAVFSTSDFSAEDFAEDFAARTHRHAKTVMLAD